MNIKTLSLCLSFASIALTTAAHADTGVYSTASLAQSACGADQVVWIDLDHGRYYKIGQYDAAKTTNGVYSCERAAHAKYREGKSEATSVAAK